MRAGLAEVAGQVSEQVVRDRADVRLLRPVAKRRCHEVELTAHLRGVAVPAGEFRPRQCQLGKRIRPVDPFRVALRLGHGCRARVLVTEQPVQLSLP